MTDRRPKGKEPAPDLPPLEPETAAALQDQVRQVAAALETGEEIAALRDRVLLQPQDLAWDLNLMAGLGHLSHPAIPGLLAALFGTARDKARRKALKRTLHLLKTRGVAVPPDLLPREEASLGKPRAGATRVFLSPILGNGDLYVILEGPRELLGGNFLVCCLNDRDGFKEAHLLSLKPKDQAEFWQLFRQQGLADWFSPPAPFAVRLLEEAYTRNPQADSGAVRYRSMRREIVRHWGPPDQAPEAESALPAIPPEERQRFLEQARNLAMDPLFFSWLPGMEEITPWLQRLQEVRESPLVLTEQQQEVRLDAVVEEASRAIYPLESRPDWRRRLLTMAYLLDLEGRGEDARAAQAAAEDLGDPRRSPLAEENLFLKGLVQYSLRLGLELQQPSGEPPSPSGLVTPSSEPLIIRR